MVRTQVYLSAEERSALDLIAERTGRTRSELIREAVDALIDRHRADSRLALLRRARGMWRGRTDLPDVRALRREWERYG